MAQQNTIAVQIPADKLKDLMDKLTAIQTELQPYVVSLTAEERRTLLKMSDKTIAFVSKVQEYTKTNGQFVPGFMSTADFDTDIKAVDDLTPLLKLAEQISDNISDTVMLSGSEAYVAALMYYNAIKQADKNGIPDARTIYADLQQRFPGRPSRKTEEKEA